MKKITFTISFVIFCFSFSLAQNYSQLRQGSLEIGGTKDDGGNSIVQTKDGGYAMTGYTQSFGAGDSDVYIAKLDYQGNLQWTKTIGGKGNDIGESIIQTKEGGYTVAGITNSFGAGGNDMYIVRLDSMGNVKWTRTIGGTGDDKAYSIVPSRDGGYIIAGCTNSSGAGKYDMYVVKLDSVGNLKWTKTYGGTNNDNAISMVQNNNGGVTIVGNTDSYGGGGPYVVMIDSVGNLKWANSFYEANYSCVGNSIVQANDGGFAVIGQSQSIGSSAFIIKTDTAGNKEWVTRFTIPGQVFNDPYSITQTRDFGYALTVVCAGWNSYVNLPAIFKTDSSGNAKWYNYFNRNIYFELGNSIVATQDGGFAAVGQIDSSGSGGNDLYFLKYDSTTNTCNPPDTNICCAWRDSSMLDTNGCIVGNGGTITSIDSGKVSSGGIERLNCIVASVNTISTINDNVSLYPNPNNGEFTIQLSGVRYKSFVEIYNMLGEKTYTGKLNLANTQIDLSNITSGIYLYRVLTESSDLISDGKFVIQK